MAARCMGWRVVVVVVRCAHILDDRTYVYGAYVADGPISLSLTVNAVQGAAYAHDTAMWLWPTSGCAHARPQRANTLILYYAMNAFAKWFSRGGLARGHPPTLVRTAHHIGHHAMNISGADNMLEGR